MSGEGAVWISPVHFFEIVGAMRRRAALREGTSPLAVPDVADDGGTSYLEALVNAVGEARTMIAASLEVAGRALTLAGTRTVDADLGEESATTFWELESPYSGMPAEDAELEEWADQSDAYYDGLNDYMQDTADTLGEGD